MDRISGPKSHNFGRLPLLTHVTLPLAAIKARPVGACSLAGRAVLLIPFSPAPDCVDKKPRRPGFGARERCFRLYRHVRSDGSASKTVRQARPFSGNAPSYRLGKGASTKRCRTAVRGRTHGALCPTAAARCQNGHVARKPGHRHGPVGWLTTLQHIVEFALRIPPCLQHGQPPTRCLFEAADVGTLTSLPIHCEAQAGVGDLSSPRSARSYSATGHTDC